MQPIEEEPKSFFTDRDSDFDRAEWSAWVNRIFQEWLKKD